MNFKILLLLLPLLLWSSPAAYSTPTTVQIKQSGHPRLLFNAAQLKQLRAQRTKGVYALIWKNMEKSAEWALTRPLRKEWIAPVSPDPIYENLYNRFYAIMNDMAIMEHLAFCYAYSGEEKYSKAAKAWALNSARIWSKEAEGEPDQGKSYAVTRLLKGLAVCYDLLFDQFSEAERQEIRDTMVSIGKKYYDWYVKDPTMGATGQGPHHATVETTSFGLMGLALLGEVPDASDWVALIVEKMAYLMPSGLTPSGASKEGHTFWASTMQYRILFLDALRRVTGQDLFVRYANYMGGQKALAAVAARNKPIPAEDYRTVLFEPYYGQLAYWTPVLFFLARENRRPIYQHFALWDEAMGEIQRSRYGTNAGESNAFDWGGYTYAWYDPSVPDRIEPNLPLSFAFPEINEYYARTGFQEGALVAGLRHSMVQVHAGGRLVFSDEFTLFTQKKPVTDVSLSDDGVTALIQCKGVDDSPFTTQTLALTRPGSFRITRQTTKPTRFFYFGPATRSGNTITWPDGTRLEVTRGRISSLEPKGFFREWTVGGGVLKLNDLTPIDYYPLVIVEPEAGELVIDIRKQ